MRKIACVVIHDYYGDYDSCAESIVTHLTDFIEVDEDTFNNLKAASKDYQIQQKLGHTFFVIEQMDAETIAKTVQQYVDIANARAAEEARRKAERERKAIESKARRAATSQKKKEERIVKLQAELAELQKM